MVSLDLRSVKNSSHMNFASNRDSCVTAKRWSFSAFQRNEYCFFVSAIKETIHSNNGKHSYYKKSQSGKRKTRPSAIASDAGLCIAKPLLEGKTINFL